MTSSSFLSFFHPKQVKVTILGRQRNDNTMIEVGGENNNSFMSWHHNNKRQMDTKESKSVESIYDEVGHFFS